MKKILFLKIHGNHNVIHKNNDGIWSHIIFRKIFNYKLNNLNQTKINSFKKIFRPTANRKNFKKYIIKSFFNFSLFDKIFMYELSFDKRITFLIKLKKFFINIFIGQKKIDLSSKPLSLRSNFVKLFKSKERGVEGFIKENIAISFPKIFLENYKSLETIYSELNWVKNPKFIMTSYGHYYDEIFKIYCSKNKISNSKVFIFQHGDGGIYDYDDYYNIGWDKDLM